MGWNCERHGSNSGRVHWKEYANNKASKRFKLLKNIYSIEHGMILEVFGRLSVER